MAAKKLRQRSDSDEESVVSVRWSYCHGRDIFRKDDPDESVEEDEEEDETEEMDENEKDKVVEEEVDDETDDDDEEERYDDDSDVDDQKIRPWDVLMNITSVNMQDRYNEKVEKTLEEISRHRQNKKLKR